MLPRAYLLSLLIPLGYLCLRYRHPNRFVTAIRLLLYVALILGAAGLTWRMSSGEGVCIAVVDRSASMSKAATDSAVAFIRELDGCRPQDALLGVVGYASARTLEKPADSSPFTGLNGYLDNTDSSILSAAIEDAIQMIPAKGGGRLVLLTDGQWNGPAPEQAFARAAARGIAINYRLWPHSLEGDVSIHSLEAPMSVNEGEGYVIECAVRAPSSCDAVVKLRKGRGAWSERTVKLRRGVNHFSWRDSADTAGTYLYTAAVTLPSGENGGVEDKFPQNNIAERLVTVKGRKTVMLLTDSPSGNLARLLREMKFNVKAVKPTPDLISPVSLAECTCVILENVSATSIGRSGMELLVEMVRSGNIGLVMTGGRSSFANGGFYDSPIEEILPVDLKQRNEKRKGKVAIMVALDRSGSMSMQVEGGVTKMSLADRATCEVLSLMQDTDEFGVIAVDSSIHTVVPLGTVKEAKGAEELIMSIESMGGGIFTYTALHGATQELLKSTAQIRHLILFADANDAEEPGKYKELLEEVTKAGITVSVIGLGKDTDSDAAFLMDVALRGNGQHYFTDRPDDLPRVFAEDTFQVALKTFITDSVSAHFTPAAREISSLLSGTVGIGGYNLCYTKPSALVSMVTDDENAAPLVASHRVGLGACAAIAFELDGKYTGAFANYAHAAELIGGVVNLVRSSQEESPDYMVTQTLGNGVLRLEMELEPERASDPFQSPPEVSTLVWQEGHSPRTTKTRFEWVAPDRLECSIPMEGRNVYMANVTVGDARPYALPSAILPNNPEYVLDDSAPQRIVSLARATGGRERLRPEEIWERIPKSRHFVNTAPFWAALAIILLLLEVAERRFAFLQNLSEWHKQTANVKVASPQDPKQSFSFSNVFKRRKKAKTPPTEPEQNETPQAPQTPPAPADDESPLAKALRQANRNSKR